MNEFTFQGEINLDKLLQVATVTDKGTYQIITDLVKGEISLVIEVSEDLKTIKTVVMDYELIDAYVPFYNENSTGEYVLEVRNAYNKAINDFIAQYSEKKDTLYLVPDQIASKYIELSSQTERLQKLEKIHESELVTKEYKRSGVGSNDSDLKQQSSTSYEIADTNERINQLLAEIYKSQLPRPTGETISYGSYVTYRRASDSKEFRVLIIQGDIDRSLSYNSDIKFASTDSPIGKALFGHQANEAINVKMHGNQILMYIIDVDNDFVYTRYADAYTAPDYKEQISQICSEQGQKQNQKMKH